MRTAITAIALAGLTSAVTAQPTTGTVTVTSSASTVSVGDTVTIGALLSDNISGPSVLSFNVRVTGSGAAFSTIPGSLVEDPGESGHFFGFQGQVEHNGAAALGGSWDFVGPDFQASLDDLTAFTFQITATQAGSITFTPSVYRDAFPPIQHLILGIVNFPADYEIVVLEPITITVIPGPSSLAPLALAFPLATRRRR